MAHLLCSFGSLIVRFGSTNVMSYMRRVEDFETLEALTGLGRAELIGLTLHRFAPWYGVA